MPSRTAPPSQRALGQSRAACSGVPLSSIGPSLRNQLDSLRAAVSYETHPDVDTQIECGDLVQHGLPNGARNTIRRLARQRDAFDLDLEIVTSLVAWVAGMVIPPRL
jgi:hypothetical protein